MSRKRPVEKRLREFHSDLCDEAADEIDTLRQQLAACRALLRDVVYQGRPSQWTTEFIAVLSKDMYERAKAAGEGE